MDTKWTRLASDKVLKRAVDALKQNGIKAVVVDNRDEAKSRVLELVPAGSEVMDMTSRTLESIGILDILHSDSYSLVKSKLSKMDRDTQNLEMQRLGAVPEYTIGSVHAVTEDGTIIIASASGSQLPAYAYGSPHVVWVVGTQKIVKSIDEGFKRIYEHSLPLEDARALKVYGSHSSVNKILIIKKESSPGRINIIFVKELLGF